MKKLLKGILQTLNLFGFDPIKLFDTLRGLHFYIKDLREIKRQKGKLCDFNFGRKYPILGERFSKSGTMSGHYFHQDLFIANKIFQNKPKRHVDIGSRTDGFVAHVAVFREIEIIDIRYQDSKVKNIIFLQADLTQLSENLIGYCDSISALHSIEHFGLGRYGDRIDYFGHVKGLNNIHKMLQNGGKFYFSAPIGKQRIEFNAHRVFSVQYLLEKFHGKYSLVDFSYVNDEGDLFENVTLKQSDIEQNFGCQFGCGIFELTKI